LDGACHEGPKVPTNGSASANVSPMMPVVGYSGDANKSSSEQYQNYGKNLPRVTFPVKNAELASHIHCKVAQASKRPCNKKKKDVRSMEHILRGPKSLIHFLLYFGKISRLIYLHEVWPLGKLLYDSFI
jgi:hypothetical protein